MGKWIIGIVIIGIIAGGGKYLDQFFGELAQSPGGSLAVPGAENTAHGLTQKAGSTLDQAEPANTVHNPQADRSCKSSDTPLLINIDPISDPMIVEHIRAAIKAGAPAILHLQLAQAEERYQKAVQGLEVRSGETLSLYPFPATTEAKDGIDTAYVPKAEDETVSRQIGSALAGYCQGQAFKLIFG